MNSSKKVNKQHQLSIEKLADLYPYVIAEYRESISAPCKRGLFDWDNIWDEKCPRSNIYRYNGLTAFHSYISKDLSDQLLDLADKYQHIFNQYTNSSQQRADLLIEALNNVEVINSPVLSQEETPVHGFLPLQEFLESPVKVLFKNPFGSRHDILAPADAEEYNLKVTNIVMAMVVFGLQLVAPVCMLMNHWIQKENYIKTPQLAWQLLSAQEIGCLGVSQIPKTMTVVGTFLLIVVNFIIRSEIMREAEDNVKRGKLLNGPLWSTIDVIANSFACLILVVSLPLIFWSLTDVVSMVCDSMGVLFIYELDDFTAVLFSYLGLSDSSYKRSIAWTSILLTKCPLVLADVVNPQAKSIDEFWSIQFDDKGYLLSVQGNRSLTRMDDFIQPHELSECDNLLDSPGTLIYRDTGYWRRLPTNLNMFGARLFNVIAWILWVLQFATPIVFFVYNDACAFQALRVSLAQVGTSAWYQAAYSHIATSTGANLTATSLHTHR